MSTHEQPRTPAGSADSRGGQFAGRTRSDPIETLGTPTPATIARASSGDVQVVYENDRGRIRVTVLMRENNPTGEPIWVEEGSVLSDTPASASQDRIIAAITEQATTLADADDPHEETAWFLAGLEGHRDVKITRTSDRLAS